jgi:hypothetical protein
VVLIQKLVFITTRLFNWLPNTYNTRNTNMRTAINTVLGASLFLGGVASAQRFRFEVSEYLGTPGEINTWEAWYATVEGTTGSLWIGDEIPADLTGVTDIRSETNRATILALQES